MKRYGIVLGAGMGTRMKSEIPKVLHEVMGKAMIEHVISALEGANAQQTVVVVGHKAELVEARLGDRVKYAKQTEQLGTAHAVMMTNNELAGLTGVTMVTYGDDPLLTTKILEELFTTHETSGAKMTMLTNVVANPFGLGRIIRDTSGNVVKIVEQKDANDEELAVTEINTGVACYDNEILFEALKLVGNENAQGEYYLTDLVEIIKNMGHRVEAVVKVNNEGALGVNDRIQLANNARIMREKINQKHMENGVTFVDPTTTYIEPTVKIATDVVIEPNVYLKGNTTIETGVFIGTGTHLTNVKIGKDTQIFASYIFDSEISSAVMIGPFAHIREQAIIGENSRIGNFVEIKKSTLATGVKAAHLSYMGDAEIGSETNISCGVITANYDGKNKYKTVIGKNVMVGSNVNLIAPVTISDGAYLAAGSTINKDVPAEAMAIARSKQENKEGYAKKL